MKYVPLDHYEFVSVIGPDARKFLQGQVTCNMDRVNESTSLRGALCNLKGRVIADFRAIAISDGILLQTQTGLAEPVMQILKKYAVFSKVEISTDKIKPRVLGCFGNDTEAQVGSITASHKLAQNGVVTVDDSIVVALQDNLFRVEIYSFSESEKEPDIFSTLKTSSQQATLEDWNRLDIEAGIFHVDAALSEEFTPQLLNYDISGVIDFKKGCYTGQEVVARMFYRSTAKKRLAVLSSPRSIEADDCVEYQEEDATHVTPILRFANSQDSDSQNNVLLAIVGTRIDGDAKPPKLTKNPQSSLQILTMPYTQ